MNMHDGFQIAFFFVVLLLLARPLGAFMAKVYQGEKTFLRPLLRPVERLIYRWSGIREDQEMDWKNNAIALLVFNAAGFVAVYALQRVQHLLPLNPMGMAPVSPDLAFNTAVSFATNTNWQAYGGETTMSYLTQMLALTVQNFLSAASGMAALVLIIRGFARHGVTTLGNFWVDMTRSVLYILLPLSIVLCLVLVSQGVVQTFSSSPVVTVLDAARNQEAGHPAEQTLATGPAASQIAIKQLGTNGGGFFNVNSSHPYENPTPLTNFLELLAILLLPAALCHTYGVMVGDRRQGYALLWAMTAILVVLVGVGVAVEANGNPALAPLGIDQAHGAAQGGGSMEGKEVRFGVAMSVLWSDATTAASNGSVNAMHDSFSPLGGAVQLFLMHLGEVVFGGVGSGLYGMLVFVVVAVFVAGLLVGRTPEYLGHKIEAFEMKMASLPILIMPIAVLVLMAIAVSTEAGRAGVANPGPHGFSEIMYAFTSQVNNNGSAFAGLNVNTAFYNLLGGVAMLIGRYWMMLPALALAGSLAGKKAVPPGAGTLPTHNALFVSWLIAVIIIVGALNFVPALALGPFAEHLALGMLR